MKLWRKKTTPGETYEQARQLLAKVAGGGCSALAEADANDRHLLPRTIADAVAAIRPGRSGTMTYKTTCDAEIQLQRPTEDGWRTYAQGPALRRQGKEMVVEFQISWVKDIRRGDRILEQDGECWGVMAIFREDSGVERPNLTLLCEQTAGPSA